MRSRQRDTHRAVYIVNPAPSSQSGACQRQGSGCPGMAHAASCNLWRVILPSLQSASSRRIDLGRSSQELCQSLANLLTYLMVSSRAIITANGVIRPCDCQKKVRTGLNIPSLLHQYVSAPYPQPQTNSTVKQESTPKTVLVLGGTGYLGQFLVASLAAENKVCATGAPTLRVAASCTVSQYLSRLV